MRQIVYFAYTVDDEEYAELLATHSPSLPSLPSLSHLVGVFVKLKTGKEYFVPWTNVLWIASENDTPESKAT